MSDLIKKLPPVFQTVTEKKFFDATFDQVFSKKDSEYLAGYLGRRAPGTFDPINDFYIPQGTKNRTWWQLEPTAYSRDTNYAKSNLFFYEDLLDKIEFYGGNTANQDRLFESNYYSWAPPIDVDMFVNYHCYYWVSQGLPNIQLTRVMASDIIGKPGYTTSGVAGPKNVTLTTGMVVSFRDDPDWRGQYTVEITSNGIQLVLVDPASTLIAGTSYEFLPWDSTVTQNDSRVIDGARWDASAWEVQPKPGSSDYITIHRASADKNAWARTNKWVHIDAILATCAVTNTTFPPNASRALRPIIQFIPNMMLYKSGTQFRSNITYGLRNDDSGNLITLETMQSRPASWIKDQFGVALSSGDLVVFFDDNSPFTISNTPWDITHWDTTMWDDGDTSWVNHYIFQVTVTVDGRVIFLPHTSWDTPVVEGDIAYIEKSGPGRTGDANRSARQHETWYFSDGKWDRAFNDKRSTNQPPVFMLYDHEGVGLDDWAKYPDSTFVGSEIFAYKLNIEPGARLDPVLRMPIIYTSLGQSSDILFHNELITQRHRFGDYSANIDGYYYYKTTTDPTLRNCWELYSPNITNIPQLPRPSKQRVVDRYVVGYGSEYSFQLSAVPQGYPANADIVVTVDGIEVKPHHVQVNGYGFTVINRAIYVDLSAYITAKFNDATATPPVVEIMTYTRSSVTDAHSGYFEIPQQLDANPTQLEVGVISGSDLLQHFSSIIANQAGFSGVAFGGSNNYRDSVKNLTVGNRILQNMAPILKCMLVSSDSDVDLIPAIRFSQDEYTKFKNRYMSTALRLMDQGFSPIQYHNNSIVVNQWVDEILKVINISKEFSNAFAYSHMVASGKVYSTETVVATGSDVILANYVDLTLDKNSMYVYDISSGDETLLVHGHDYRVVPDNLLIHVQILNAALMGAKLTYVLYENPKPAYIPSTPTKLGLYGAHLPRIELDTSYAEPTQVIVGHDGATTIAYGDYRDQLLLELELRIYNLLHSRYTQEYSPPVRLEMVKSGFFRKCHYTHHEYLDVVQSYLNKWCAKNKANYRTNEWAELSTRVAPSRLWRLYNYTHALTKYGDKLGLPGNWKGIYKYLYDTCYPDTRPWEMLGLSQQPHWWVTEYGPGVINSYGQTVWSANHITMWADLEMGVIRHGPSAVMDHTGTPTSISMWARPGLRQYIPVDSIGEIVPLPVMLNLALTTDVYHPYDDFDADWQLGDGSPVEQAWASTSAYAFNAQELMFLMKPGVYGEFAWDTLGVDFSPGKIGNSIRNVWYQRVQNDQYDSTDPMFKWMRPRNNSQVVHAETIDGVTHTRFGYQRWISDRIMYHNKSVTDTLGVKIRNLGVNLANKLGGFTNKDTVNMFMESVSMASNTSTMGVPSNNFEVVIHRSPPVQRHAYSGVIVKSQGDGTFVIYGYDLLESQFVTLDRTTHKIMDVTVGGTPAGYTHFLPNEQYRSGDIVKYNGVYYSSNGDQTPIKFLQASWTKLNGLPIVGGISVIYKPVSDVTKTNYAYGTVLPNPQSVFDFLIGWGAYLESDGWDFTTVDPDTNTVNDWLSCAKQFLFWINSDWAADSAIQLSPLSKGATLKVKRGYPNDVELISNGVYSILDKRGVAIPTVNTVTQRDGQLISVSPVTRVNDGIFFLQITTSETEHALVVDNVTSFNDIVYSPLLRTRQDRMRFNGFRSNGWYGKMEAPGYIIMNDALVPNYDTIVNDIRYHYDANVSLDDSNTEDLGRRLIGHESKTYMDSLQISNDIQYLFYKGMIRQKGTEQTLNRLFRSGQTRSQGLATVYEEWALRLCDMGNTVGRVSTEFILKLERDTGEVAIANLNYVPSTVGHVWKINMVDATTSYTTPPTVVIDWPTVGPAITHSTTVNYYPGDVISATVNGVEVVYVCHTAVTPGELNTANWTKVRPAQAYTVLGPRGTIQRVDVIDNGYGYTHAPTVRFHANGIVTGDTAYAVWQGEVVNDMVLDNLVNIDIDDPDTWVYRPNEPGLSAQFPTTTHMDFLLPNSGYVHYADVDWFALDVPSTVLHWGTDQFNPAKSDTVWIAKTYTMDWDVFKMVDYDISWHITNDSDGGGLMLLVSTTITVGTQYSGADISTDFGNLIVLQVKSLDDTVPTETNYTLGIGSTKSTYTNSDGITYSAYKILTLDGVQVQDTDIPDFAKLNTLLFFKSMRYATLPSVDHIPTYVGLGELIWVDDMDHKWAVLSMTAGFGIWDAQPWDLQIGSVWGTGVDGGSGDQYFGWDTRGPIRLAIHRIQEPMIDATLFDNASIFPSATGETVANLPVFDPFKGLIPGIVKQNLTYITELDPARYNVTSDARLRSDNVVFDHSQVGQLWWDTSTAMYLYYEQPQARNGSETVTDVIKYRRDNWGRMFPGSVVDVYEWVESAVTPEFYDGAGQPRDISAYTAITQSDNFTNVLTTRYYFWVSGTTSKPNLLNRTMTASEVATFLTSPRSQGYSFFAPIHQTATSNAFMFYNVQGILANRGNHVRVEYRHSDVSDQDHSQWCLFREGDTSSPVLAQYWNQMVDSICGYTAPHSQLPGTISVKGHDVYAVPDPILSSVEQLGIKIRPRQSMFAHIHGARKVLVQALNRLLITIPVRDMDTKWVTDVPENEFWAYTTWYKPGYESTAPVVLFPTLTEAFKSAGMYSGEVLQVIKGTVDGRPAMYQVTPSTGAHYQLDQIAISASSVQLTEAVYTSVNDYGLSVCLRQILTALRSYIFADEYSVYANRLFSAMLNYVVSEQRTPDWVFKTSYVTLKESATPLAQTSVFSPSQIDNIIDYIVDVKPYHTQLRNYTSVYSLRDTADGVVSDWARTKITLNFGPGHSVFDPDGWDTFEWDSYGWDKVHDEVIDNRIIFEANTYAHRACPVDVENVPGTEWDSVHEWDTMGWDADPAIRQCPQIFGTTPGPVEWDGGMVAWDRFAWDGDVQGIVLTDDVNQFVSHEPIFKVMTGALDVGKRGLSELWPYTFTFDTINMNDPQSFITPSCIVSITTPRGTLIMGQDYYVERNDDNTYTAYLFDDPGSGAMTAHVLITGDAIEMVTHATKGCEYAFGYPTGGTVITVDTRSPQGASVISYRQVSHDGVQEFMRNSLEYECRLLLPVTAPTIDREWLDQIHLSGDNLPDPHGAAVAIWIGSERIEYRHRERMGNTWVIKLVRRGTRGTSPQYHPITHRVFVEMGNRIPVDDNPGPWNADSWRTLPDLSSEYEGKYSRIANVSSGGLWSAKTPQAAMLLESPGRALD